MFAYWNYSKIFFGKSQVSSWAIEKVSGIFPQSDRHTDRHRLQILRFHPQWQAPPLETSAELENVPTMVIIFRGKGKSNLAVLRYRFLYQLHISSTHLLGKRRLWVYSQKLHKNSERMQRDNMNHTLGSLSSRIRNCDDVSFSSRPLWWKLYVKFSPIFSHRKLRLFLSTGLTLLK